MNQPEHTLVLTTLPAGHDALAFATRLVEERLAACVTILGEAQSVYRWEGRVTHDRERQLLVKTIASRVPALTARIAELHPSEVPEIVAVPIHGGLETYLRWVSEMTI
ncbi:MAG: divalent-cation tolerance protein CutA [Acidobacteria bacterium]|nr:divalent-cation tolerance protein CutA [Acidobacteriota bacterium]